jgi:hypothetical protein
MAQPLLGKHFFFVASSSVIEKPLINPFTFALYPIAH